MRGVRFLLFLGACFLDLSQLQADENFFERGLVLYNQNDWINSQQPLRVAAKSGNKEAQYYLAESLRLANRYMTEESAGWYVAAAEQGDIFAMLRLSQNDDLCANSECGKDSKYWKGQAHKIASSQAKAGNGLAMQAMYYMTGSREWLVKASSKGNAEAGYFLVKLVLSDSMNNGSGHALLSKDIRYHLEKSAEGGNPHAMALLSTILSEEKDYSQSRVWLDKCLLTSHYDRVLRLELIHQHLLDEYVALGYVPKKSSAYGLLLFRRDALGKEKTDSLLIEEFENSLSVDEKKEGVAFFEKWKKTHPPLSYHVRKFGF